MDKVIKYTETAFYIFQKNTRKINAIIKRKQIRRIKVYIMLVVTFLSSLNSVFAIENPNIQYGIEDIKYVIDSKSYIRYNGILQRNTEYYYIKNNEEYTAYCIDLGLNGAELHPEGHYNVDANKKIDDNILRKIVLNSYPYKTIEEIGVKTIDEARFVSQFAIWCYTSDLNLGLIEPASNEYQYIVDSIVNIYNSSLDKDENYNINLENVVGEQKLEKIKGEEFYTKEVEVVNMTNINSIAVTSPENNIKVIQDKNKYKVYIPVDSVDKYGKYTAKINYEIVAKENAALIGTSTLPGYQNVVVTLKEFFNHTESLNIDFDSWNTKIVVKKQDKDTLKPLSNVKYEIRYENGELIGVYETDNNGEFTIDLKNNQKCVINIKELMAKEGYIKDLENHKLEVNVNDLKEITLVNEKQKGYIQINKKTKEYNELTTYNENTPLKDVSFYIYDINGKLVDDITTDKYGKAITSKLEIGKYYIQEYKTQSGYKVLEERVEVEISQNDEIVQVNILNENVDIPKKLPVTGR